MSGFVVADPGGRPEMAMIAAGLARAGLLRTLIAPFGGVAGESEWAVPAWAPAGARRWLADELRRREMPASLTSSTIDHAASFLEAMAVGAGRIGTLRSLAPSVTRLRDSWFDRRVGQKLDRSDSGVVAVSGAAERTLAAAGRLGIASFLECPIAHHRAAARLLREEAQLQPEYASTMQFHDLPASLDRRLDAEIRLADKLLVLSTYQRETFLAEGVEATKLMLVPLGVDTDFFRPEPRRDDSTFRVIFVGQITQRKGISYLIEAFVRAAIPRSELVLLGRVVGTNAPWRGQPNVRHINHVPRWELPSRYNEADVYVLPSLAEGFPLTAAEAMACGLPVIVSENTFGRDVVTDGLDGFVVPVRDSKAISDRLRYLFEDQHARSAIGAAARATAEKFSWERYGERIVSALAPRAQKSRESGELTPPTLLTEEAPRG